MVILAMGPDPAKIEWDPAIPECLEGTVSEVTHTHLLRTLIGDVCVLEDMTIHLPIIEIRIVECRGRTWGCGEGKGPVYRWDKLALGMERRWAWN